MCRVIRIRRYVFATCRDRQSRVGHTHLFSGTHSFAVVASLPPPHPHPPPVNTSTRIFVTAKWRNRMHIKYMTGYIGREEGSGREREGGEGEREERALELGASRIKLYSSPSCSVNQDRKSVDAQCVSCLVPSKLYFLCTVYYRSGCPLSHVALPISYRSSATASALSRRVDSRAKSSCGVSSHESKRCKITEFRSISPLAFRVFVVLCIVCV